MTVFCLYGVGVDTERRYRYARRAGAPPTNSDLGTIDYDFHDESFESGVESGDGDGTVPLVSMAYPCAGLWRDEALEAFNPSRAKTVLREYVHDPVPLWQDARGGTKTAKHVEILGNSEVIKDILSIATGHDSDLRLEDRVSSDIFATAKELSFNLVRALGPRVGAPA